MRRFMVFLALALAPALAACGGGETGDLHARVESNPAGIGVGQQRVLVSVIDVSDSTSAASPDIEVVATLRDRIGSPLGEYPGEFVWVVPDVRGLYAFQFDIPGPGTFQITLQWGRQGELGPVGLVALADPSVVGVGEPAPLSETRTIPEYPLSDISSDPDPAPTFYELSVAEAVGSGATVIVFGTPVWCVSQTCGPMLNQVKALSTEFPDINFVHVEIYDDIHVSTFEELVPVPSVAEWGLVSEPIIFVTDSSGLVSASFEGAASDNELRTAFGRVAP